MLARSRGPSRSLLRMPLRARATMVGPIRMPWEAAAPVELDPCERPAITEEKIFEEDRRGDERYDFAIELRGLERGRSFGSQRKRCSVLPVEPASAYEKAESDYQIAAIGARLRYDRSRSTHAPGSLKSSNTPRSQRALTTGTRTMPRRCAKTCARTSLFRAHRRPSNRSLPFTSARILRSTTLR